MRLELTGAVVVFAAAVAVGVVSPRNAGLAGLALTSALNLTGTHPQDWGGGAVTVGICLGGESHTPSAIGDTAANEHH
mgnify:CR=1